MQPAHENHVILALYLLLIGMRYQASDMDDNSAETTSSTHRLFIESLLNININSGEVIPRIPCGHGKYDGLVAILYHFYGNGEAMEFSEKLTLTLVCELLSCFEMNVYSQQDFLGDPLQWFLLSYEGICTTLKLLDQIFSKTPNAFYTHIPEEKITTLMNTICLLLQSDVSDNRNDRIEKSSFEKDLVKILCLPFAVDLDQSFFYEILCVLQQNNVIMSLFKHVKHRLKDVGGSNQTNDQLGVIVGLIARLVLTDEMFIAQFKTLLQQDEIKQIVVLFLYEYQENCIRCDVLAILSHLARQSSDSINVITETLRREKGGWEFV